LNSLAKPVVIEPTGSKQGQEGTHRPAKKKRKPGLSRRGAKRDPKRMRIVLDSLREKPSKAAACRKADIGLSTLDDWLEQSAAGASGYNVKWLRHWRPFHEHYEEAMDFGFDRLKEFHCQRGVLGYDKVLKYGGRVTYQIDPILEYLGAEGRDAYLRDKSGKPIPETIRRYDMKSLKWLLKRYLPEKYGERPKHDPQLQGPSVLFMPSAQEIMKRRQESSDTRPGENVENDGQNESGE
jgi:hypothetical protein